MNKGNRKCAHCGCEFESDPRVANHRYCGKKECQRAKRRIWQREKMQKDSDYRDNQKHCAKEWHEKHPDYYKKYRKKNPQYTKENRARQKLRDMRRRRTSKNGLDKLLAKMDSIGGRLQRRGGGIFKLIPRGSEMLAKMDSMTVELIPV